MVAFLRPEIKFANFDALLTKIHNDINLSKELNFHFNASNSKNFEVYQSVEEFINEESPDPSKCKNSYVITNESKKMHILFDKMNYIVQVSNYINFNV